MKGKLILIFVLCGAIFTFINISEYINIGSRGIDFKEKESVKLEAFIKPDEYQKIMGIGIDVDFAKTKKSRENFNEKIIKDFASIGIKHIRIRVVDDISESLLKDIQVVVDTSLRHNIVPIIAYQADEFKNSPNEKTLEKSVKWWGEIAKHFKDYSYKLSFDNMIEATDQLNKSPDWQNKYHEEVTKEIRKTNPTRIIFISPIVRSEPEQLPLLKIPTSHNNFLMAEFHFYASGPSRNNSKKLWTVGTEEEKNIIRKKIKIAKNWGEKNNIKLWVGAWMPGDYNDKNDSVYSTKEQVNFANFISCELKKNNIPHAFNADHHFYDMQNLQWIETMLPVINTILNPNCAKL